MVGSAAKTSAQCGRCSWPRVLVGIPVYNEEKYVAKVLSEVQRYANNVLVVDDGSTDETPMLLAQQRVEVIRHSTNRGYGRSMWDMFRWAAVDGYEWLITMDCDEQHEPAAIPRFMEAIEANDADVISGSRYLENTPKDDAPPEDRRAINAMVTDALNRTLDLELTDAFCGFKAYRVSALQPMDMTVSGYDFPMQFWVQAKAYGLRIKEIPVRLIYNDPTRSFGGPLNDAEKRKQLYMKTMQCEIARMKAKLPAISKSMMNGCVKGSCETSKA
ncbi:MAG TPA: glycosyltransferase family 2 protein [Phycisphaerales bacterium]|nr:glycosyltransferase family 2 protein [Phycisphaerales bacterium]